jgi:hypothetical protein
VGVQGFDDEQDSRFFGHDARLAHDLHQGEKLGLEGDIVQPVAGADDQAPAIEALRHVDLAGQPVEEDLPFGSLDRPAPEPALVGIDGEI